jgi:hypothetical protein
MRAELAQAFADTPEKSVDALVDEVVHDVRAQARKSGWSFLRFEEFCDYSQVTLMVRGGAFPDHSYAEETATAKIRIGDCRVLAGPK